MTDPLDNSLERLDKSLENMRKSLSLFEQRMSKNIDKFYERYINNCIFK